MDVQAGGKRPSRSLIAVACDARALSQSSGRCNGSRKIVSTARSCSPYPSTSAASRSKGRCAERWGAVMTARNSNKQAVSYSGLPLVGGKRPLQALGSKKEFFNFIMTHIFFKGGRSADRHPLKK